MAVAEPEFAFRMGRDLPPRNELYETEEVLAAIAIDRTKLCPAIVISPASVAEMLTDDAALTAEYHVYCLWRASSFESGCLPG